MPFAQVHLVEGHSARTACGHHEGDPGSPGRRCRPGPTSAWIHERFQNATSASAAKASKRSKPVALRCANVNHRRRTERQKQAVIEGDPGARKPSVRRASVIRVWIRKCQRPTGGIAGVTAKDLGVEFRFRNNPLRHSDGAGRRIRSWKSSINNHKGRNMKNHSSLADGSLAGVSPQTRRARPVPEQLPKTGMRRAPRQELFHQLSTTAAGGRTAVATPSSIRPPTTREARVMPCSTRCVVHVTNTQVLGGNWAMHAIPADREPEHRQPAGHRGFGQQVRHW